MWGWISDTFLSLLSSLGLYNKSGTILFLGLDNAGKSTLLHLLHMKKLCSLEPTRHPQMEEIQIGSVVFRAHDLGGHKAARKLWKDYLTATDGVVYLVDAADRNRFEEAKDELQRLFASEEIKGIPFVILGNKIDLKDAVGENDLKQALGITQTTGKKNTKVQSDVRPLEVFMCSIVNKAGYADGFKWLSNFIGS